MLRNPHPYRLPPDLVVVVLMLTLSACTSPIASATPSSVLRSLPTFTPVSGVRLCAGEAVHGPLRLSAVSGAIVAVGTTRNFRIVWPPGYVALFSPDFVGVLTDRGDVFARAVDDLNSPDGMTYNGHIICVEGPLIEVWAAPTPPT